MPTHGCWVCSWCLQFPCFSQVICGSVLPIWGQEILRSCHTDMILSVPLGGGDATWQRAVRRAMVLSASRLFWVVPVSSGSNRTICMLRDKDYGSCDCTGEESSSNIHFVPVKEQTSECPYAARGACSREDKEKQPPVFLSATQPEYFQVIVCSQPWLMENACWHLTGTRDKLLRTLRIFSLDILWHAHCIFWAWRTTKLTQHRLSDVNMHSALGWREGRGLAHAPTHMSNKLKLLKFYKDVDLLRTLGIDPCK